MKVFLDSTYLFPACNVDITEGWSKSDLKELLRLDDYTLYYSDLSLIEIYTKCMKLILQKKINVEIKNIQNGIQTVLNSPKLHRIDWWENIFESDIIYYLKEMHNDSIDCTLFYLAAVNCDVFATFDETLITKVQQSERIKTFMHEINPVFKYWEKNIFRNGLKFLFE